jgi:O-antigen/teichoic acid export membrane protein
MFILTTKVLALLFFPAIAVAAAASAPIFHVLLSEKWSRAGLIFMLVAPAMAIQCVSNSINVFLMALGRTDIQVRLATLTAALWLAAMFASIWFGIEVVAISYTVCILVMFAWTLHQAMPILNCSTWTYLRCLHVPLLVATLDTLLYYFGSVQLQNNYLGQIGLAAAIVSGSLLASLVIQRVELTRQFHIAGQALA